MSLLKRISNIINGKANAVLDDIENPIELLNQTVKEKSEALERAKLSSAEFLGSIMREERELKELKEKREKRISEIKKTKANGDLEMAKKYLISKHKLDDEIVEREAILKNKKEKDEVLKNNLLNVEKEIEEISNKKAELQMKLASAKAVEEVNKIVCDINDSGISIKDIERKIASVEDRANGLEVFKKVDDEKELDNYARHKLQDDELDKELENY